MFRKTLEKSTKYLNLAVVASFSLYRFIKYYCFPWVKICRFEPSCSEYSIGAFKNFPFPKALWLMTKRIMRCHPFCPGGLDPLPLNLDSRPL